MSQKWRWCGGPLPVPEFQASSWSSSSLGWSGHCILPPTSSSASTCISVCYYLKIQQNNTIIIGLKLFQIGFKVCWTRV